MNAHPKRIGIGTRPADPRPKEYGDDHRRQKAIGLVFVGKSPPSRHGPTALAVGSLVQLPSGPTELAGVTGISSGRSGQITPGIRALRSAG